MHRPRPELPPELALEHLRQGNVAFTASRKAGGRLPTPGERPAGAGRYLAAVVVCADAGIDVPALLSQWPEDLLLLSLPSTQVSAEAIAVLERAVTAERLSLCLVLTHAACPGLQAGKATTPAQELLERRTQPARALAQRRNLAVDKAQALLQRECLLAGSELLRQRSDDGKFRVVPASVDGKAGTITWHTTHAEELEVAPVK
ncbi:MAG TPA: hypothetical protein VK348_00165 [Planctomycetota bacterium]|nr:hypothetical protein [Planctomycetota bacterium]